MAGTIKILAGPVALSSTLTTNIYVPASALIYDVVRHIHIANKHASIAATFNIYLGATGANAAGTELWFTVPVAVGGAFDWYGNMKLTSTTFLVGGSNTATALTITIMGESYVV